MEQPAKICQSCSMPLRREEDLGTDADGSRNKDYCHFCFQGGKFTDEGITMEQKIEKNGGQGNQDEYSGRQRQANG